MDNQNGFRKNRSTVVNILTITYIIETKKINKKDIFTAFIDFRKAYYSINRNLLFEKIRRLGINGSMYKALIVIYDNLRCSVGLNGLHTEWFDVKCVLKQGLIFLILTVPRQYFCCGSLLLHVLAVHIFTLVHLLCKEQILGS